MNDESKSREVRLSSYGAGGASITGLTVQEVELIEGAMHGHQWVTVKDGRLQNRATYKPLPGPADDVEMMPFWNRHDLGKAPIQRQFFFNTKRSQHESAHITITSLCGYNWTPEAYVYEAEKLERFGFVCLRSRRGASGRYHEMWVLYGLYAAKGELQQAIVNSCVKDSRLKLSEAVSFLRRNASFGTLDVSVQRLAMVMD